MKIRNYLIIIGVILLSLLIPIHHLPFIIILIGIVFTSSALQFCVSVNKKIFYPGLIIYKILLYIILFLQLHFTKNLIFYPIRVITEINYSIGITFAIGLFIYDLIVIISFLYKTTTEFDPLVDMNLTLFKIDGSTKIKDEDKLELKYETVKASKFYTKLSQAYKGLFCISVFSMISLLLQALICYLRKDIHFKEAISNATIFNFIIFISIGLISTSAYTAAKRYYKN